MNNEQALNNLWVASGKAPLTRDEHAVVQVSYQLLKKSIKPEPSEGDIVKDYKKVFPEAK